MRNQQQQPDLTARCTLSAMGEYTREAAITGLIIGAILGYVLAEWAGAILIGLVGALVCYGAAAREQTIRRERDSG